jgi:hypothetical protein
MCNFIFGAGGPRGWGSQRIKAKPIACLCECVDCRSWCTHVQEFTKIVEIGKWYMEQTEVNEVLGRFLLQSHVEFLVQAVETQVVKPLFLQTTR